MNFVPGMVVTVRHYSLLNVFKSSVTGVNSRIVTLQLTKEVPDTKFLIGDPLVVAFMAGGGMELTGGRLAELNPEAGTLDFEPDINENEAKNRMYERYPLSHYADIRMLDTEEKGQALVKDISHYGMQILSNKDLLIGQRMDIDIFLLRDILYLKAEVVRKRKGKDHMEYGLKILHNGPTVYNRIVNYIKKSQEEHLNRFNKD